MVDAMCALRTSARPNPAGRISSAGSRERSHPAAGLRSAFFLAIAGWAVILLAVLGVLQCARAETVSATGSGLNWNVALPPGATNTLLRLTCYDCDVRDEGRLTINGGTPITLFGADNAALDRIIGQITVVTPVPEAASLVFSFLRTANSYRIDAVTVEFTLPALESPWLTTAKGLETSGWVPSWLTADDDIWIVSREDTEPARTMVCATDKTTGARSTAWLTDQLATLPTTQRPAETACDVAWCFASGPSRPATIRSACP
jgi:hypothetical protein